MVSRYLWTVTLFKFYPESTLQNIKYKFSSWLNILLVYMLFPILSYVFPQQKPATGSDILLALKKLNVLGRVLYIGAHPEDENTSPLSYMSKGQLMRTAYFSITRGDGGPH